MKYFSSDWHLGHTNIIKYCQRPFIGAEEMDAAIFKNFFNTVKAGDEFYYLGDLSFHFESVARTITLLHGAGIKTTILVGNHDNWHNGLRQLARTFEIELVHGFLDLNIDGQLVTLCHYAMMSYYKSHFNAWLLYGHHHSNVSKIVEGKKMNVGVDQNNFLPVSWDQVKAYMKTRPDNWDLIHDLEKRF